MLYYVRVARLYVGCLLLLLLNAGDWFFLPNIFNNWLRLHLSASSTFLAAGGLIIFRKCLRNTHYFQASVDDNPSDLNHILCRENSSYSSLPTSWFEKVNNEVFDYDSDFMRYMQTVYLYVILAITVKAFWYLSERGTVKKLLPLASAYIRGNRKELINEKADIMLRRHEQCTEQRFREQYFKSYVFQEILCLVSGLLFPLFKAFDPYRGLAVHLNDSEWTVACYRQVTSLDAYTLTKCSYNFTDKRFESICIVPVDDSYLHLDLGIGVCNDILTVSSFLFLMYRIYQIRIHGFSRMNDIVLVDLIVRNMPRHQSKEIVFAFRRKLDEKRRANMDRKMPEQKTE